MTRPRRSAGRPAQTQPGSTPTERKAASAPVSDWLLAGDPAIRWQVMRDLLDTPRAVWEAEQARVATHGWGARLLSYRDPSGRWTPRLYGRKWISTTYSLLLLRQFGLPGEDARARDSCLLFLDEGLAGDGGIDLSATQHRSETCITGFTLALLSWFGITDPRRERLLDYLLDQQLADGGWNCQRDRGASHSSLHTTINVLEGLHDYTTRTAESRQARTDIDVDVDAAADRGREFLLAHQMFRSHRTGAVIDPRMLRPTFPPRWRYDVLRGLDHLQTARAPRDDRLSDAIDLITGRRRPDGRWPQYAGHPGTVWFTLEPAGAPGRWNTLRALRVLRWWTHSA